MVGGNVDEREREREKERERKRKTRPDPKLLKISNPKPNKL